MLPSFTCPQISVFISCFVPELNLKQQCSDTACMCVLVLSGCVLMKRIKKLLYSVAKTTYLMVALGVCTLL